ncbi:MAG: DUF899 family protein [Ilumatobacteraceae bacterium]|nr:DUF899 family protein [Ilumatobacteraceae bacterium]
MDDWAWHDDLRCLRCRRAPSRQPDERTSPVSTPFGDSFAVPDAGRVVEALSDARDTTFAAVSRAPLEKLERYKHKRGWTFPWYSSFGSDFNYDYHVSLDASVAPVEFNFRGPDELKAHGLGWTLEEPSEQPGYSTFLAVDGQIFHTYSVYARGTEWLGGSYAFLDLTALGRQEDWEEPKGRSDNVRGAVPDFSA